MKPTVFAVLLFVGILSTMWLAAVNHNAIHADGAHYAHTIPPEVLGEITTGMTMAEVTAIVGREPDDMEVAKSPASGNGSVRAFWKGAHQSSLYLRFVDGSLEKVLSKPLQAGEASE